jgi:hypothetical protein
VRSSYLINVCHLLLLRELLRLISGGISEVTLRPEREEDDRLTRPTRKPDLAGETGTQDADAMALAEAEAEAVAQAQTEAEAEIEIETGPTPHSQRQRKAPTRQ